MSDWIQNVLCTSIVGNAAYSHGVSYLVESKFVFRSGMQHTINLTLNNNPDMVRIEIGGEIENGWE